MKRNSRLVNRVLAMFLAFALVIGMVPMTAQAAGKTYEKVAFSDINFCLAQRWSAQRKPSP